MHYIVMFLTDIYPTGDLIGPVTRISQEGGGFYFQFCKYYVKSNYL